MRPPRLAVLFALVALGCATPALVPAPEATRAAGRPKVAVDEVAGVRLSADGGAWKGSPAELPTILTPIRVVVENRSGHPLRVAYRDFSLLGEDSGFRYAALPPFSIQGTISSAAAPGAVLPAAYPPASPVRPPRVLNPAWESRRFLLARPYLGFYRGLSPWPYGWDWDLAYHGHWFPEWPTQLPTEDMLNKALPEGVVEDGGHIAGFIYFQRTRQDGEVQLQFQLTDAQSGEQIGTASVPFIVRR